MNEDAPVNPMDEHDACAVFDAAVTAREEAENALREELTRLEARAAEIRKRLGEEKKPRRKRTAKPADPDAPKKPHGQRRGLGPAGKVRGSEGEKSA